MKNKKLNQILVVVITVLVLFLILKDNFTMTLKVISKMNVFLFILAIIMYVIVFTLEAIISMKLVQQYKHNYSFKDAFKLSTITRFFNGITPFSVGGRPLQIYELRKYGVRVLDGTNVVVQNFVIFQTSLTIYSIITMLINIIFKIFPTNTFLYNMTILGFIINVVILLGAIILSISKTLNKKIINIVIKALYKLKIIKNKEEKYKKFESYCNDYYNAFKDFEKNKDLIIKCILIELIALTVFYSVVVMVFMALGVEVINPLYMIIASNFVFLTGCFVPIPGGSGGIEYAFTGYIGTFASSALLPSILIVWRFTTYYFPTLVGGIVFNIKKRIE